jgi:hypothetical protein
VTTTLVLQGGILAMAAVLLCGSRTEAQTGADKSDIRIVSSFVAAAEPVPEPCQREAKVFAQTLVRYPRPLSWHWVLVCDEAGWRRFLRLSGRAEDDQIYASTDLEARTSYLRGQRLLHPGDLRAGPDEVVAHELAHIWLESTDEGRAECLARWWQEKTRERPGTGAKRAESAQN